MPLSNRLVEKTLEELRLRSAFALGVNRQHMRLTIVDPPQQFLIPRIICSTAATNAFVIRWQVNWNLRLIDRHTCDAWQKWRSNSATITAISK
jgi:hypothetical protein